MATTKEAITTEQAIWRTHLINPLRMKAEPGTWLHEFDQLILKLDDAPDKDTPAARARRRELQELFHWDFNHVQTRLDYLRGRSVHGDLKPALSDDETQRRPRAQKETDVRDENDDDD